MNDAHLLALSRSFCWLTAVLACVLVGSCRSPTSDSTTNADAADGTGIADGAGLPDAATTLDAAADVAEGDGADDAVAADVDIGPPPTSCPPDPTPTWSGMAVSGKPFSGSPMPGDDCAWPGWPSAPAPTTAEWTRVTPDLGLDGVGKIDLCLIWHDVTGDGIDDLVTLLTPTTPIGARTLLIASGQADGGLSLQTWPTTLHAEPWDCGIADFDQDGVMELALATNAGLTLLSLDPKAPGADVTADFNTPVLPATRTLAPMDFDSDGDVDLYVTGAFQFTGAFQCLPADGDYWMCCVPPYDGACMKSKTGQSAIYTCCDVSAHKATQWLLRNDGGKFTDVSKPLAFNNGLQQTISPFDLDRDGHLDFFGGDDFGRHGWFHRVNDSYVYHGTDWGMRPYAHVMGSVVADFDLDRKLELVISDVGADTIYRAGPTGFADVSKAWDLWTGTRNTVTWSEMAADLDNDGWLDLVTTASLVAVPGKMHEAANKSIDAFLPGFDLVSHNLGKSFVSEKLPWVSPFAAVFDPPTSAVLGDYDHDHDPDLFVLEPGNKLTVWRNNTPPGAHWLVVQPVDKHGPVLNAQVQVWSQGHVLERWIQRSTGFGAHVQPDARFGLGSVAALDVVRVWWPDGQVSEVNAPSVDQVLQVARPSK